LRIKSICTKIIETVTVNIFKDKYHHMEIAHNGPAIVIQRLKK